MNLKMTTGEKPVGSGEYAYIDDDNQIICRLEVRQVEKTKITLDTKECFYIIQGNENTDATKELVSLATRFCKGDVYYISVP